MSEQVLSTENEGFQAVCWFNFATLAAQDTCNEGTALDPWSSKLLDPSPISRLSLGLIYSINAFVRFLNTSVMDQIIHEQFRIVYSF